jgi:uncharacterized protein
MPNVDNAIASTVVWAELATPDLAKARAFYGELLGWSYVGGDDARTGFYTMAQRGGRNIAALCKKDANSPGPSAWRIYFGSDDVTDTARKVAAAGGRVLSAPMDVMEHGRLAVFADPSGAPFGVWQAKQHSGAQLVNEPGAMAWHEVYTRDASKAREFYTRVFGLEARRLANSGVEYWTLNKGASEVCGLMQMTDQFPKEVPSHWNTYFAVSDADAATKKAQELGATIMQPPFDVPHGRMSAIDDPLGAGFALIKLSRPR